MSTSEYHLSDLCLCEKPESDMLVAFCNRRNSKKVLASIDKRGCFYSKDFEQYIFVAVAKMVCNGVLNQLFVLIRSFGKM